jgi:hypothetical protein
VVKAKLYSRPPAPSAGGTVRSGGWRSCRAGAYRPGVTADSPRTCALCGNPIEADEAWMTSDAGDVAHSGCVYRDDETDRGRWMPPDVGA